MGVLTRAKKRRATEVDRISNLPDGVLGDIVSLLPTKDGARTRILSSRWRHLWCAAPLNFHLLHEAGDYHEFRASEISRILSAHHGPCRRFVMPRRYDNHDDPSTMATLDGWFRSPALDNLQELNFYHYPRIPMSPSVYRFSTTLRVGSFGGCAFPDGSNGGAPLLLPVLESLTLLHVSISGSTLLALLAGCPALQSFVLIDTYNVSSPLQIVSPSLKSIKVSFNWKRFELVIEDAPCLERIECSENTLMNISVISAPRLAILGELSDNIPRLRFGTTVLQGSTVVTMAAAVHSVKALSLFGVKLCLDTVINLLKCFPHLEMLHIKARSVCVQNAWYQTNPERIGTVNIRMQKIVLENYQGSESHVDFVNFFLSNARALESVELRVRNITTKKWIRKQQGLLNIKSASGVPQVTFVSLKKT